MNATLEIKQRVTREANKYFDKTGGLKEGLVIFQSVLELARSSTSSIYQSSNVFCVEIRKYFNPIGNPVDVTSTNNKLLDSPLLNDVLDGREVIESNYNKIAAERGGNQRFSYDSLLHGLNDLISKVMLSVQKLVKNSTNIEVTSNQDELLEGHLVKVIIAQSDEYFRCLNVEQVQTNLQQIIKRVREISGSDESDRAISLTLHALLPVLSQYSSLVSQICLSSSVIHRSTCKLTYVLSTAFAEIISKGFCPPAEFEEELAGDKGELKDVEDAGIGEGEGNKDVSDQIEEENQVEDTPGSEPQEQNDDEIPGEDNAIEMTNDFEGKFQDDAPMEEDENDSDEEQEEEDIDKQMGDLGDEADTDRLDERMWGSDDEDEEEEKNEKKEEKGAGMDSEQSELGAKDDEMDSGEDKKKEPENIGDQSEFDPNEQDETHAEEPSAPPEEMDLPDDMQIDDDVDEKEDENKKTDDKDESPLEEQQEDSSEPMNIEEEVQESATPDDDDDANNKEAEENSNEDNKIDEDEEEPDVVDQQNEPDTLNDDDDDDDQEKRGPDEPHEDVDKPTEDNSKDEEKQEEDSDESAPAPGKQLPAEEKEEPDDHINDKTSRTDEQSTEDEVVQSESANEQVSQMNKEEGNDEKNQGSAPSSNQSGEESATMTSNNVTDTEKTEEKSVDNERHLGHSDAKRTLGDSKKVPPTRLRMIEDLKEEDDGREDGRREADLYQHMSSDVKEYDQEMRDAATEDQIKPQSIEEDSISDNDENNDIPGRDAEDAEDDVTAVANMDTDDVDPKNSCKEAPSVMNNEIIADTNEEEVKDDETNPIDDENLQVEEKDLPMSSIHTNVTDWEQSDGFISITPEEIARIRAEMEEHLRDVSEMEFAEAENMWHQYQSVTQPLSQQLSEQLRLILEPTQLAKLKGDYRSGKRLNMRKVIPYIASGFRKDKIWLRRSKPSKREYQIMVAIDDSSSMSDNHTKQLAFEALAVISTALSTLEAGQLSVCNFGENTQLLHDFNQPFTDHSGALILQRCSFQQDQTKVAKLLDKCVKFLKNAQANYRSSADPRLSQLLLIVSDGRGIYMEGKERVKAAVRAAKRAGIFLAFVVLDNPAMKDSIMDIKEPIFKETGEIKEIRSYMADFPFPFYVVIRNINALPETLSEALRQWFEIVTSGS